jgi:phosphoribosylformylglycinamidine synthase
VIQVRASEADAIATSLKQVLPNCIYVIGELTAGDVIVMKRAGKAVFEATRVDLHRAWSETTYQMQKMRDNPACAQQEYDRILDKADSGLHAKLTFDPSDNVAAPYIATGVRPKMAILREQGVNGQTEMAAAFDRAGFATYDVTPKPQNPSIYHFK